MTLNIAQYKTAPNWFCGGCFYLRKGEAEVYIQDS